MQNNSSQRWLVKMPKALDLIGQHFGSLLVIEKQGSGSHGIIWKCQCQCGKTISVTSSSLISRKKNNNRLTCGCIKSKKRSEFTYLNSKYNNYKQNAKKRNLSFSLTREQSFYLFKQNCYWCGASPSLPDESKTYTLNLGIPIPTNGIDRYDNSFGYESTNCVSCCTVCNRVKWHLSGDDFLHLIKTYYSKHFSNEQR